MLAVFATAFVAGLSGAMVPGPLLTMTVGETLGRGPRSGMMLIVGHGLIELALVVALFLGLRELVSNEPVLALISLGGGLFLLWMAYSMARSVLRERVSLSLDAGRVSASKWGPVARGAGISVSNPYWTIWWASSGAVLMASSLKLGPGGVAVFYTGHVLSDFAWYGLIVLILVTGQRFVSDRAYRALLLVCAAFLLFLAFGFIYLGAGHLVLGRPMPLTSR